jgi:hypothetical protein
MFMVLVQANGRDSPQDCPFDRLRNTAAPFRNRSRTHSSAAGDMHFPGISWGMQNALSPARHESHLWTFRDMPHRGVLFHGNMIPC